MNCPGCHDHKMRVLRTCSPRPGERRQEVECPNCRRRFVVFAGVERELYGGEGSGVRKKKGPSPLGNTARGPGVL